MKFIFLGSPGSGKSTQAKLMADYLCLPLVEMGQIFREKAKGNDLEGQAVKKRLDAGELVPDEIAVSTLKNKLKAPEFSKGYILDGYPRNTAQLNGLESDINRIFFVNVSDEEALRRLSLRAREGETENVLKKRLQIYREQTEPLLLEFKVQGKLVEIDGERTIEEIHEDILKRVKNYEK